MAYETLKNYVNRKAAGKLTSTKVVNDGVTSITVFKKAFDEDGDLLPDLDVLVVTSRAELDVRLAEIQAEKNIINNFIAAEGL